MSLQITWGRTLRIWWSFIWRYILCTLIFEAILIFLATFSLMAVGRTDLSQFVYSVIGIIAAIPFSIIVLNKILQKQFKEFSIGLVSNAHQKMEDAAMDKKPKISLKASVMAVKILLVPFTIGYALFFMNHPQKLEMVFGVIGFMYFYSIEVLARHLFLAGAIKMKPWSVFFIAFFSSAIPLVHLIVPVYLLKKSKGLSGS